MRGFYETKVVRPAAPMAGRVYSPLEDRLSALKYADLQDIVRNRGLAGSSIRNKRELVFRIAEDMRLVQDEVRIFDYEVEYGSGATDNLG